MTIGRFIKQLIERLENTEWNLLTATFWIASLSFTRGLLELFLFDYCNNEILEQNYLTHKFEMFFPAFYFALFLTGIIIIKFFTKKKIEKVIRVSLPFYSLIILPPILDRLLGNTSPYYYITDYALLRAITKFPGIAVVVTYIILLIGIYIFISSGFFKSFLAIVSLMILYLLYATTFPIKLAYLLSQFSSYLPLNLQEQSVREQSLETLLYLLITFFALLFIYWIHDAEEFKKVFKAHFRALRITHYLLLAIWGYSLIGNFQPLRLFLLFCTLLAGSLAFQFAVFINDLYDKPIDLICNPDRGFANSPLTRNKIIEFALLCAILSLYLSLLLSSKVFGLILLLLAISYFYSVPPIRFRRSLLSPIAIGVASFLAFLFGFLSQVSMYSITTRVLITGGGVAIGMTLGTTIIDLKDLKGDRNAGVWSIPVLFGFKKGKMIIASLVTTGYLLAAGSLFWVTHNPLFGLVIIPAFTMCYLTLKFENSKKYWQKIFRVHFTAIVGGIILQFIKI